MAETTKTFRIFVSSTFGDLEAERDALQKEVFPNLRELCRRHGYRFQAIDLRWGVSEEAAIDQQTMNICLEELRRCQTTTPRPNCIVLLSNRYGWRPLPPQIEAAEFEALLARMAAGERTRVKQWYRRDNNAVPAEYCLLPREGGFKDGKAWAREEAELRAILLRAVEHVIALHDPRRVKYEASATHQEIIQGVLNAKDAANSVFCYLREIEHLPLGSRSNGLLDLTPGGSVDAEAKARLEALKRALESCLPVDHFYKYRVQWPDGLTEAHVRALYQRVEQDLRSVIEEEIGIVDQVSDIEREVRNHRDFAEERARHFMGRGDVLERIQNYITGRGRRALVIYGKSGAGKTAVMARASLGVAANAARVNVLSRFIGVTPGSSDIRSLLDGLCREIGQTYGDDRPVPSDSRELAEEFRKRLAQASAAQPVVIFLDALDQLGPGDNARSLDWLPRELPDQAKLVVSVMEEEGPAGECLETARRMLPPENFVPVGPLSMEHGEGLLDAWLREAGRTLQAEQRREVLDKFAGCPLPLFLKLTFEEARRWKSYDRVPNLSRDIPGIVGDLFVRLEAETNHGRVLVSRSLAYLSAARHGLTEDELLDLLSADGEVMADFRERSPQSPTVDRLPLVVWSRLYFDLAPYLTERRADRTSLLSFYHRQVGEAAVQRYLTGEDKLRAHRSLAAYFSGSAEDRPQPHQFIDAAGNNTPNYRKLSELPFQQTQGRLWSELEQTLMDLNFVETKCTAADVFAALRDYLDALAEMPEDYADRSIIVALSRAIDGNSYALRADPTLLVQQVYNTLVWDWDGTTALGRMVRDAARGYARLWLKRLNRPPASALLRMLPGHTAWVMAVVFSPNGKWLASASGTTYGEEPGELKLWDMQTGEPERTLSGHTRGVTSAAFSPDSKTLASGGQDDTVKLWDLRSGRLTRTLAGPQGMVSSVAFSPDGTTLASGSGQKFVPGEVRLWTVQTGELEKTITLERLRTGPETIVWSVAFSPDGTMVASGSDDRTVRLWDTQTGELGQTLEGHSRAVSSVAFSPDGKTLASGSEDGTVRLWDVSTRAIQRASSGERKPTPSSDRSNISSGAFSPDGKTLATGGVDGKVSLWDAQTAELKQALLEHSRRVHLITFSPDGKTIASVDVSSEKWPGELIVTDVQTAKTKWTVEVGLYDHLSSIAFSGDSKIVVGGRMDGNVRLWDADTGELKRTVMGPGGPAHAVTFSADLKTVVSGSSSGTVYLWYASTKRPTQSLTGHGSQVFSVSLSANGKIVASGGQDQAIRLWDAETGAWMRTLAGHSDRVNLIVLAPDGKMVASGGGDRTVRLWDAETGQLQAWLPCTDSVLALWLSPDARELRVADEGGGARVPNVYVLEIVHRR